MENNLLSRLQWRVETNSVVKEYPKKGWKDLRFDLAEWQLEYPQDADEIITSTVVVVKDLK